MGMLITSTQSGQMMVSTIIYNSPQSKPFSMPVKAINFLPTMPQALPPRANVMRMSKREVPFTFHLRCNFCNILQMCSKTLLKCS